MCYMFTILLFSFVLHVTHWLVKNVQPHSFTISERKLEASGLSSELVNGDHLAIPGMRDYPYGSLGAYNQLSPSPKSVTPQSPSSASMPYTVGEFAMETCLVMLLSSDAQLHCPVKGSSWHNSAIQVLVFCTSPLHQMGLISLGFGLVWIV